MMLIGCLEREYLKNGLIFDVNSSTKSDLIGGINFRNNCFKKGFMLWSGKKQALILIKMLTIADIHDPIFVPIFS